MSTLLPRSRLVGHSAGGWWRLLTTRLSVGGRCATRNPSVSWMPGSVTAS
ncbi:hypothetical protein ABZS66_11045 [Dactylosporangium sp. NPDC005572]